MLINTQLELERLLQLVRVPHDPSCSVSFHNTEPNVRCAYRVGQAGAIAIASAACAADALLRLRVGTGQVMGIDFLHAAAAMRSTHYLRVNDQIPNKSSEDYSGYYATKDGRWMLLHAGFKRIRERNLAVLASTADKPSISRAVLARESVELEESLATGGGVGAIARSLGEWLSMPQSAAAKKRPVIELVKIGDSAPKPLVGGERPLSGVRVLDLTRVLAGPTSTRTLAEHGAEVLRINGPDLCTSGFLDLDTGLGKRSTILDIKAADGRAQLLALIKSGDVFVQSYRPGSLASHGFGPEDLARMRPGIVYGSLSAWGVDGPWADRRGYDTIVQAANGMAMSTAGQTPQVLPVSLQDYVAGYFLACGLMAALRLRATEGGSWMARVSLAGVGEWIRSLGTLSPTELEAACTEFGDEQIEAISMRTDSSFGVLTHLAPVAQMAATPAKWVHPSAPLNAHTAHWMTRT